MPPLAPVIHAAPSAGRAICAKTLKLRAPQVSRFSDAAERTGEPHATAEHDEADAGLGTDDLRMVVRRCRRRGETSPRSSTPGRHRASGPPSTSVASSPSWVWSGMRTPGPCAEQPDVLALETRSAGARARPGSKKRQRMSSTPTPRRARIGAGRSVSATARETGAAGSACAIRVRARSRHAGVGATASPSSKQRPAQRLELRDASPASIAQRQMAGHDQAHALRKAAARMRREQIGSGVRRGHECSPVLS